MVLWTFDLHRDNNAFSIPADEPGHLSTDNQAECEEPMLISELIHCVQEALTASILATDCILVCHSAIQKVIKRVALYIVLELNKQLHLEKWSHSRDCIGIFTGPCCIVFGEECDVRFERSFRIRSISSEFYNVVGAYFVCDVHLCSSVCISMMQNNNKVSYKWSIHHLFAGLLINLAEVNSIGRASKMLGVHGHKRVHELTSMPANRTHTATPSKTSSKGAKTGGVPQTPLQVQTSTRFMHGSSARSTTVTNAASSWQCQHAHCSKLPPPDPPLQISFYFE